jgi:very-short-patch-repair endonuclease
VARLTSSEAQLVDAPLAKLTVKQHGVVATWELFKLGYSHQRIAVLVANGWLHRLYRGVYAVGHTRLSVKGRWMAAVLACGPDAVLSHRCAAALHDLQRIPSGKIDVTAHGSRVHRGIRCHRSRSLPQQHRTTIDGIPVTSIERTLLDLAAIYAPQRLRSTIEEAQRRDLLDRGRFDALLAQSAGHRGATPLKRALAELGDEAPWTQSGLERDFLELIREAGLPEPRTNVIVDGELVDVYWPVHDLIVELDGYDFHRGKRSFEDDRRKDTKHLLAGRRSIRVTGARVAHERRALLTDISALLAGGAASGP